MKFLDTKIYYFKVKQNWIWNELDRKNNIGPKINVGHCTNKQWTLSQTKNVLEPLQESSGKMNTVVCIQPVYTIQNILLSAQHDPW